jgi:hypothetical protein
MLMYLRIAVTALCLTACVLLVALWVRSYTWVEAVRTVSTNRGVLQLVSIPGRLGGRTIRVRRALVIFSDVGITMAERDV